MIIRNWADIRDQFTDATIILGNGSSIAFDQRFHYDSLLQAANDAGFINAEVQAIFDQFQTNDFELILLQLWQVSASIFFRKRRTYCSMNICTLKKKVSTELEILSAGCPER